MEPGASVPVAEPRPAAPPAAQAHPASPPGPAFLALILLAAALDRHQPLPHRPRRAPRRGAGLAAGQGQERPAGHRQGPEPQRADLRLPRHRRAHPRPQDPERSGAAPARRRLGPDRDAEPARAEPPSSPGSTASASRSATTSASTCTWSTRHSSLGQLATGKLSVTSLISDPTGTTSLLEQVASHIYLGPGTPVSAVLSLMNVPTANPVDVPTDRDGQGNVVLAPGLLDHPARLPVVASGRGRGGNRRWREWLHRATHHSADDDRQLVQADERARTSRGRRTIARGGGAKSHGVARPGAPRAPRRSERRGTTGGLSRAEPGPRTRRQPAADGGSWPSQRSRKGRASVPCHWWPPSKTSCTRRSAAPCCA